MRFLVPVCLVGLALAGCSGSNSPDSPSDGPSSEGADPTRAATSDEASVELSTVPVEPPSDDFKASPRSKDFSISGVVPEPAIMATMECEPLGDEVLARIAHQWGEDPAISVQVKVGEGLAEGETWWIVAWRDDPAERWSGSEYFTNAPGLPGGERGKWISSGGVYAETLNATFNGAIHWDRDGVTRVQSALAASIGCLDDLAEEHGAGE